MPLPGAGSGVTRAWYADGLRFSCLGSCRCCRAQSVETYVFLNLEDRRQLAAFLGLATATFTRRYCSRTDDDIHLNHPELDCIFLQAGRCRVYEARPEQCRTWPFWPENMSERVWNQEVLPFCAGAGQGRLYSQVEIEEKFRR